MKGLQTACNQARSPALRLGCPRPAARSCPRKHRTVPCATRNRSHYDTNAELLRALVKQVQTTTLPAINDLTRPWLTWDPEPLSGTLDPEELGDTDSKFLHVDSIKLHYKDITFYPSPRSSSSSGSLGDGTTASSTSSSQPHQQAQQEPLTLLLIHGFNGWVFSWRSALLGIGQAVADLGRPCRLIAFDRPPFGLSERPLQWEQEAGSPYSQEAGAKFAQGLLRAIGVQRCIAVGHSAGAGVAVDLALRAPELVTGLVLVSPALATQPRNLLSKADLGQLLRFAAVRALLATDGPGLVYVRNSIQKRRQEVERGEGVLLNGQLDDAAAAGYLLPLKARDWDKALLLMYRSFGTSWAVPVYDQLHQPVLVVQGDLDTAVPRSTALDLVQRLQQRPATAAQQQQAPSAASSSAPDSNTHDQDEASSMLRRVGNGNGTADDADRNGFRSSGSSMVGDQDGNGTSSNSSSGGEAAGGGGVPATEYVELPSCGHIPMDEYPLEFDAAVLGFLQRHFWQGEYAQQQELQQQMPTPPPAQTVQYQQQQSGHLRGQPI